jgi:phosphoheptose isomerase
VGGAHSTAFATSSEPTGRYDEDRDQLGAFALSSGGLRFVTADVTFSGVGLRSDTGHA